VESGHLTRTIAPFEGGFSPVQKVVESAINEMRNLVNFVYLCRRHFVFGYCSKGGVTAVRIRPLSSPNRCQILLFMFSKSCEFKLSNILHTFDGFPRVSW
jgi:hypothetical protein